MSNPERLHDELTGTSPIAASPTGCRSRQRRQRPIADDSRRLRGRAGQGIAPSPTSHAATPSTTCTSPSAAFKPTTSRGPITLPATPTEPTLTAAPTSMPRAGADARRRRRPLRLAAPSRRSARLHDQTAGRRILLRAASPSAAVSKSSEAAKAFQSTRSRCRGTQLAAHRQCASKSLPVAPRGALTGEAAEARRESFTKATTRDIRPVRACS